jgi:hypothetical protein
MDIEYVLDTWTFYSLKTVKIPIFAPRVNMKVVWQAIRYKWNASVKDIDI